MSLRVLQSLTQTQWDRAWQVPQEGLLLMKALVVEAHVDGGARWLVVDRDPPLVAGIWLLVAFQERSAQVEGAGIARGTAYDVHGRAERVTVGDRRGQRLRLIGDRSARVRVGSGLRRKHTAVDGRIVWVVIEEPVRRLRALADVVAGAEVAAHRHQPVLVPADLIIAFDIDAADR